MANSDTVTGPASKVAAVTLSFWILKVVTTTAGDLSGDFLSITLGMGYVVALIVALVIMGVFLAVQLRAKQFYCLLFWTLVWLSSTVGAEVSDAIARTLHWGTPGVTGALLVCLAATLVVWRVRRGKLGFYPIKELEDEFFYWIAAIFANSLGSVIGDLVGDRLGFGVLGGVAVNAGVLALLIVLRYKTKANRGLLFWTAFIFSRVSL